MSREHEPHTPHSNPTDERIPHSGRHGYEQPHREFDNTSLGEAHEMGYLETPDSPAPIAESPDKKPGKRRVIVAGGVAAVAAVAAGVVGVSTLGGDKEPGERPPGASAPVDPSEAEPTSLTPEQVAELVPEPVELTVERYGTDGEALTRAYMAQFNDWMTANAVPEAKRQDYSLTLDEWVAEINKPVDDAYIEALFVEDWQQRPQLRDAIDAYRVGHANGVKTNLMTTDSGNGEDLEPYQYGWELTHADVRSTSEDKVVVNYRWEGRDNSGENRGDVISSDGSFDGATGGATLTWINEGGTWKIVDHEYYAG